MNFKDLLDKYIYSDMMKIEMAELNIYEQSRHQIQSGR